MRSVPFEYSLGQAAKYWNVPPWVLANQSLYWMGLALDSMRIDRRAQQIADKIAERRRKGAKAGDDEEDDDTEE